MLIEVLSDEGASPPDVRSRLAAIQDVEHAYFYAATAASPDTIGRYLSGL